MAKRGKKKGKSGTPKKRGEREAKAVRVLTIKRGRGRAVGDSRSSSRSGTAFKKSRKGSSSDEAVPRPSYLPTGEIKSKLMKDD
jgi:hypothetical protein